MQNNKMTGGLEKPWQQIALEENPTFSEQEKLIIRNGPQSYLPDEVIFYQEQMKLYKKQ